VLYSVGFVRWDASDRGYGGWRVGTDRARRAGRRVGAIVTLTKQLSEADIALFVLVTEDAPLDGDEPPDPVRGARQAAPLSYLAALLTNAAARHAGQPAIARIVRQSVIFHEPAYTDDTVTATAEIVARHAADRTLGVSVRCDNQEGRRLAEGEMLLRDD